MLGKLWYNYRRGLARRSENAGALPALVTIPRESTLESGVMYIYLISQVDTPYFKIGVSIDPYSRLATLQTASPHKLTIDYVIACVDEKSAFYIESSIHKTYASARRSGEWFEGNVKDVIALIEFAFDLSRHALGGFVPNKTIPETTIVPARKRPRLLIIGTVKESEQGSLRRGKVAERVYLWLVEHPDQAETITARGLAEITDASPDTCNKMINAWRATK